MTARIRISDLPEFDPAKCLRNAMREALYKPLRPGAQPRFKTSVRVRVCAAMGMWLTAETAQR